jgi:hypothetical protein
MALRYLCSLPNPGTDGVPHELFYTDDEAGRARAEMFSQRENKPGRGVYDCIGVLKAGAKGRRKDDVAELEQIVVDLDLKNIKQLRDEVLQCLRQLALSPSEIRDSGLGLHAVWRLKEAVDDEAGLSQAESVMRRLVELLAGDPAPPTAQRCYAGREQTTASKENPGHAALSKRATRHLTLSSSKTCLTCTAIARC